MPRKAKKLHWTQRPENKERLRKLRKKSAAHRLAVEVDAPVRSSRETLIAELQEELQSLSQRKSFLEGLINDLELLEM